MSRLNRGGRGRAPSLLPFIVAVAIVFGGYYLLRGFQNFMQTGGLGVEEATQRADVVASATAGRVTRFAPASVMTVRPTASPPPECQDFEVDVPAGIVREGPSPSAAVVTQFNRGTIVCVLGREADSEWYTLDLNENTRRIDLAYMHETVIEAVNPTPTSTRTSPPTPTSLADAATETPTPNPTVSREPNLGLPTQSQPGFLATVTQTPST